MTVAEQQTTLSVPLARACSVRKMQLQRCQAESLYVRFSPVLDRTHRAVPVRGVQYWQEPRAELLSW